MSKKGLVEFIKLESIDTGMWKPFRGEKTTNVQWQLKSTIITESALNKTQFINPSNAIQQRDSQTPSARRHWVQKAYN